LVQGTTADDGNSHENGLAVLGLKLDAPTDEDRPFTVWPENEQIVDVFGHMLTQFHIAEGGIVLGLRYEGLPHVYRALRVGPGRQRKIFPALQVMEGAAVAALNRKH
jgi:hypothetical protein